ncbi:unnamed protein product [Dibothriocephalus latus]|uniref:Uncharacterized protein n=1 Tax=Dibothriocephalus latus TaxID=60516 RepID=A0A3P7NUV2_DIBLA|nr:unnamed protein product [Dibothriocephalus latus]
MGLSQQQHPCSGDLMDHLSLATLGGANPGNAANTAAGGGGGGGRLAPNLVGGLKMDEYPSRSFETDLEESSNRSSSVPPCGDGQDSTGTLPHLLYLNVPPLHASPHVGNGGPKTVCVSRFHPIELLL